MRSQTLTLTLTLLALMAWTPAARAASTLQGAWQADRYYLANGSEYVAAGQILFTEHQFSVVYIVVKDGTPQRGSGEAGDYTVDGANLVFKHRFLVTTPAEAIPGLGEQQSRHVERPGTDPETIERATFRIDGDHLTLFFPSGNRLTWTRLSP